MPNRHRGRSPLHRWIFMAAVCSLIGVTASVRAQVGPAPAPAPGGDDQTTHDDKSTPPGVSVADSPGAQERLDKAREKETQKQWKTAAEYYQEALTKYPGRVVPIKRDPESGIYHYAGIATVIQERLAKWPDDGLKIYRNLYGQPAADLLNTAARGDLATLRTVFWTYFATDAGKTAGIRLMDDYLESGDFQAAAWTGNRLLTLHPGLSVDRAMVLYRTALAYQWAGNTTDSQRLLADLKQSNPTAVGSIAGKDVLLVDSLSAALSAPALAPTTRPWDADTYPSFGGIGERGDISSSTAKPGASLNSIPLTPPDSNGMMGGNRRQYADSDRSSLASGGAMGIMPAADNGSLFFQDGRCIYAVDSDSGSPLPGWLNTYTGEHAGRYKLNVPGRARNELLTVTVTPSSVLAILGQPDHMPLASPNMGGQFLPQNPPASTIKLVCLDRDTGRELWTRTPLDLPQTVAALQNADYCGTALYLPASATGHGSGNTEDSILVVARGGKDNQFDDCYVVCLALKTGQYRWSTYIGSATRSFDMDGTSAIQPSQMSLADGRVFVMTNLGTVAALDPSDGRMIWLNSYTRDASENPEAMFIRGGRRFAQMQGNIVTPTKPWLHNPVIVSDGFVYVLPNDAKNLFVYDEGAGNEQRRIPMSLCDDANVMLGVRGGLVCLTSDKGVFVIDWRKFSPEHRTKFTVWEEDSAGGNSSAPTASTPEVSTICGRGFLTADAIFIPTKFRLVQKSWKSGKTLQWYPSRGDFTGNQGPGNLLVTARNVVVAGQEHVDVYTNLSMVRQRFELAMAAAPGDPGPRMEYAEALFAGGQTKDALVRVDEAINLTGGMHSMRSGKERTMIYNRILDFCRRIAKSVDRSDASPEGVALGNDFFDRAAAAAETPLQQATYRLERAKFDHLGNDFAGEVRLCQEVLSDDAMRSTVFDNDVSAAATAEAEIDAARSVSHGVYDGIEQQAEDALKISQAAGDPLELLKVASVYPNSKAATLARQEAVQHFEAANQPDKAIEVLRRMYSGATDPSARADLLVSIANDYLAIPGDVGAATDRLCRASYLMPSQKLTQKLHLPDGTTLSDVTYADAITTLRQIQSDQETAALPDFHLPVPKARANSPFLPGEAPVIGHVTQVVHPLQDFNRNDQILTWSPAGLCIYPAGQTAPMATIPAIDKSPLAAAWVHDSWIVWTSSSAYRVSGDGRVIWTFSTNGLPTLPVSTGGDAIINEAGEGTVDDNVNQVNQIVQNGRVIRLGPNGVINIQQRLQRMNVGVAVQPPPVAVTQHPGEEEIVAVRPGGSAGNEVLISTSFGRILSLEGRNGQILWQTRPADHAVDQLLANMHFTVIRLDDPAGSQLAVFDTITGRVIGRRVYGQENTPRQLVNAALSEDSMLAVTLFNQVMVKDLYDPWKPSFTELTAKTNVDAAPFVGLNLPGQLLLQGGRLVCLYGGAGYLRSYDLSKNVEPTKPLATAADTAAVTLRMIGSRLFVQTSSSMHQYNLADPAFYTGSGPRGDEYEQTGDGVTEGTFIPKLRDLFIGKDYAVVVNDSVDRGPLGSPNTVLTAFRRALVPGKTRESGNMDWIFSVARPPNAVNWPGVTDWLCSDSAIYYLTKDDNLHILRGARP